MPKDPYNNISFIIDPWASTYSSGKIQSQNTQAEIQALKDKIAQQEGALLQQDAVLKTLTAPPYIRATVVGLGSPKQKDGKHIQTALISVGGQSLEVQIPDKMTLLLGTQIRVSPKNMAIIDVIEDAPNTPNGMIISVASVLDENTAEIEVSGLRKTISTPMRVERGDRILVDNSMSYTIKNLGKQVDEFKADVEAINVDWNDIGGQQQAKVEMQEAIEGPIKHHAIFKAYGKKTIKGILLYGPPGCGKTMLAKAAATSLANLYGKTSATGFIYVKGPEILNKWVGQSEETIRNLFSRARDHFKREGYPATLFIDEADAILSARGAQSISGMEKTVVPMFLAEMDGLDENGPLVLLATNRSDSLDPAIVRDGRIDRKIEVVRPNEVDTIEIFSMYLKDKPICEATKLEYAKIFSQQLFKSGLKMRVCGALIAGLVDQAVSQAMRRDIAQGLTSASGLTMVDIEASIRIVELQNMKVA